MSDLSPFADEVEAFERAVFEQTPVDASHYDQEYFASDWRDDDNRYDLETRRRIEDRNPALIKEVFEPDLLAEIGRQMPHGVRDSLLVAGFGGEGE